MTRLPDMTGLPDKTGLPGRIVGRRTVLGAAGAMSAAGLVGCVRVPSSGPVENVTPSQQAPQGPQVVSKPKPPTPGESPLGIVYGFLAAMQGYEPGYNTARQYLTPAEAKAWNPTALTTIYESEDHPVVATEESATLRAPVIGTLDSAGYFQATQTVLGSADQPYDFELVQVPLAGRQEWRIGNPPPGLLISRLTFESYTQVAIEFLTPDTKNLMAGIHLVPDLCYLPEGNSTPTAAAQALFGGSSEWLAPAIMTAIPAGGKLSVPSVAVDRGVAEVTLSDPVTELAGEQRTWLAAQAVWTLSQFPQVNGVRFTVNQQAWAVEGQSGDGVVRPVDVAEFPSSPAVGPDALVAVRDKIIGQIELASGRFTAFSGAIGQASANLSPEAVAADPTLSRIAFIGDQGASLQIATPAGDDISTVLKGAELTRPQFLDDGTIWLSGRESSGPAGVLVVGINGESQVLQVPDSMKGLPIRTLRVSPDRTRIAVVAGKQGEYLGLLRLRVGTALAVEDWHPLPLSARRSIPLNRFADVGWLDGATLVVLGAPAEGQPLGAYLVSVDGARIEAFGVAPAQALPVSLAVAPTRSESLAIALGQQGGLYRLVGGATTWTSLGSNFSQVAFPG